MTSTGAPCPTPPRPNNRGLSSKYRADKRTLSRTGSGRGHSKASLHPPLEDPSSEAHAMLGAGWQGRDLNNPGRYSFIRFLPWVRPAKHQDYHGPCAQALPGYQEGDSRWLHKELGS